MINSVQQFPPFNSYMAQSRYQGMYQPQGAYLYQAPYSSMFPQNGFSSAASSLPPLTKAFTPKNKEKSGNTLSIFYINDMHGNIDNMSGMIAASDKFDKKYQSKANTDTLKISAGDNISGGNVKKNQLVINLLARMGINFSAVGNHEFDSTINTLYKYLNPNKTKFLAANAKTPTNSEFYNNIQKSDIIDINGTKYGVVGLLPFDLETVIGADDNKMQGIRPENLEQSAQSVNEEIKKLQSQGVNRIILVSHIGNDKDKEIASKLHGVDIIVGGHSHTEVEDIKEGENLLSNADGDPVVIVQTGENAKNIGILSIDFDENGIPIKAENNLIPTVTEKNPALEYLKDATLGSSPVVAEINLIDPKPANKRTTPCAWTNIMCDAMREETGTDLAFINAANTRKVPKRGKLTERDITDSTPLKNTLLVKKMTEKEVVLAIKDALDKTFSNETGEPGILHTSGLNYVADTNGNLIELNFVDKTGNKTPIDINYPSDKVYSVCYDSFVAKGTEYPTFVPEKMTYPEIDKTFDFDKDKFLIDYLKKMGGNELNVQDDHRITILDNGTPILATDKGKTSISKKQKQIEIKEQPAFKDPMYPPIMPFEQSQSFNANLSAQQFIPFNQPLMQPQYLYTSPIVASCNAAFAPAAYTSPYYM